MRKIFIVFGLLFILSGVVCARSYAERKGGVPARSSVWEQEPDIIRFAREGTAPLLRRLFAREFRARRVTTGGPFYYEVMRERDSHGNNALHVARTEEVFSLLYSSAHGLREELLSQRNKAGETPWMSLISYDRANIFLKHFYGSDLRRRMLRVKKDLKSDGASRMVAEIRRDALVKECSAGGQTLWQRADALWRMARPGSREKALMYSVRNAIGQAAPFLVR